MIHFYGDFNAAKADYYQHYSSCTKGLIDKEKVPITIQCHWLTRYVCTSRVDSGIYLCIDEIPS